MITNRNQTQLNVDNRNPNKPQIPNVLSYINTLSGVSCDPSVFLGNILSKVFVTQYYFFVYGWKNWRENCDE